MVKSSVTRYIKSIVLGVPQRYDISVMQIEQKIEEIIKIVEPQLAKCMKNDFGVKLIRLDIEAIEVDKTSEEFYELSRRVRESTQISDGVLEEINKFKKMFDNGIISESEFEVVKRKLIERM